MNCPLRALPRQAVAGLAVFFALLATPVVAGEIFKCVAKDGSPLYQNYPCYIDSLGSLPSNPFDAKTPSVFKCVAKDGGPLYQNFPCYLDSLGSLPSNPSDAKTPSVTGVASQEKQ